MTTSVDNDSARSSCKRLWIGALSVASLTAILGSLVHLTKDGPITTSTALRGLQQTGQDEIDRPIIYTYYTRVETDMTQEADDLLMDTWSDAWFDAGWQPKILTIDDAKKHPDYDALIELIVDPDSLGPYNMACYTRWIAMAASGGGWMADYDTLPLNPFLRHGRTLPNKGKLTIFDGFVPDLISGSASEYFRVVKLIGLSLHRHVHATKHYNEHAAKKIQYTRWSDMLALKEIIGGNPDAYVSLDEVLKGDRALTGTEWGSDECQMTIGKRAVHFSHDAMKKGKTPFKGAVHRGTVAKQWLNMWREKCELSQVDG